MLKIYKKIKQKLSLEIESTTGFPIYLRGIFHFPWHRHQIRRDQQFFLVFLPKDTGKWGEQNCPGFKTAAGGFEPWPPRPKALPHDHRTPQARLVLSMAIWAIWPHGIGFG